MYYKDKKQFIKHFYYYHKERSLKEFFYNVKNFDLNEEEMEEVLYVIIINMIFHLQKRELSKNSINDGGFKILKSDFSKIFKEQNLDFSKIEILTIRNNLRGYKIGNIVFKLFNSEKHLDVPESKYNAASITKIIEIEGIKVGYQIMGYLKPLEEIFITEEEKEDIVYKLFKKYKEEGKVWVDPRIPNVGRLINDNVLIFDGVVYGDSDAPLKIGEFVNFDFEYIYRDEDFDPESLKNKILLSPYKSMEYRYLREKTKKLNN